MKEIQLTQGKLAFVDDEDYDDLIKFKWHANSQGKQIIRTYAVSNKVLMHRYIMKCDNGELIDHIDGNGLNNQRYNLRRCTLSQNSANRRKQNDCLSRYKGVTFDRSRNLWSAYIRNGHMYKLGRFQTEKEAAIAYNQKAIELFGEFALLNEVLL